MQINSKAYRFSLLILAALFCCLPHAHANDTPRYDGMVKSFIDADWPAFEKYKKEVRLDFKSLSPAQRLNINYMRTTAYDCQPKWWPSVSSVKPTSFKPAIWNKTFGANYIPSRTLGVQVPIGFTADGKLAIVVSWRPDMVDDSKPLLGDLAKLHHFKRRHLAEIVVWHELGHNYISVFLPTPAVLELYQRYGKLFHHLQEFYADMTALHHCSPKARLLTLMFRLDSLSLYDSTEQHTRAAHAIGSILLAEFMENPDKWPSVHFPPHLPKHSTELSTIIYIYERFSADWTLEEDKALRQLAETFIKRNGDSIFKRQGKITLPNRNTFELIASKDKAHQDKRDDWVETKLKALIKAGRADKSVSHADKELRVLIPVR